MLKKYFKRWGSRGQVLVLYALLLPILFLFLGVAFDFGWLYFNQSKLQNAADAAVVAGAYKIKDDNPKLAHYTSVDLISDIDESFLDFRRPQQTATVERIRKNDTDYYVSYLDAKKYVDVNIQGTSSVKLDTPTASLIEDSKVHTKTLYYSVLLSGKVDHLFNFAQEKFGSMSIKAYSVARLTEILNEDALMPSLLLLKDGKKDASGKYIVSPVVIYDWQRSGQTYSNPRTVRTTNGSDNASRQIEYTVGNTYRTENIILDGNTGKNAGNADMTNTGDSYWRTYAAMYNPTNNQYYMDDMFIDFRADIKYNSKASVGPIFTEDWDITMPAPSEGTLTYDNMTNDAKTVADLRIISTINFNKPYEVRKTVDDDGNKIKDSRGNDILPSDPLYIRIESEPIYNDGITNVHSSVRQIVINVNSDNTLKDSETEKYLYRPMVIFYDGPEKLPESTSHVRDSLPVIINLNADFRGIIVTMNSSVVINGNGHKFYGFVIAKDFIHTKTDADFSDCLTYTKDGTDYLVRKDELKTQAEVIEQLKAEADTTKFYYINQADGQLYSITKNSNVKDADDYNTTDYIRPKYKFDGKTAAGNSGAPMYVLNGAEYKTVSTSGWYEYTTRDEPEKAKYCLDGLDNKLLLSYVSDKYGGWELIEDITGKQWLVKRPDNLKELYPSVNVDGETKYIGDKYYAKYETNSSSINHNSVYLDQNGEVQYEEEPIAPSKNNSMNFISGRMNDADKTIFNYASDFNLGSAHYDRFSNPKDYLNVPNALGVVPARGVYYYLDNHSDDIDCNGDVFFTVERAGWIT